MLRYFAESDQWGFIDNNSWLLNKQSIIEWVSEIAIRIHRSKLFYDR
jgi:hypothetical protein